MEPATSLHEEEHRERRSHRRQDCQFPAHFSIVLPDESLTPFRTMVFVMDISPRGALLRCPCSGNQWLERLRPGYFCRLMVHENERVGRLFCRIAWTSECKSSDGTEEMEIGVLYDELDPVTARSVPILLDRGSQTAKGTRFT